MKIAFVGLGNMGLPMAKNLLQAGHDVRCYDPVEAAMESAAECGLTRTDSAASAANSCEAAIMMLPNGKIATAVASEVIPAMSAGGLLIDCSTIDVESARIIHTQASAAGVLAMDAPVSGGIGGAAAGTLTFMAGGSTEAMAKAAPLFDIMGQKTVACGDAGAGQGAKICNNMMLAISMIGACEAFNLGDRLGLDRQKLFDVMSTSSGSCWSINTYSPVPGVGPDSPANRDYQPGFAASLMVKDSGLSQDAARAVGAATPLGEHATNLYREMMNSGMGDLDFSAMLTFLQRQNAAE